MCLNYTHSLLRVKFGSRGEDGGLAVICCPSFALGYSSSHRERRRVSAVKGGFGVGVFVTAKWPVFVLLDNAPLSSSITHLCPQ